jgi:hypothetical protein
MNRAAVIAELRRSAMEDRMPWYEVGQDAYDIVLRHFRDGGVWYGSEADAMAFLLIAESLERP